MINRLLLLGIGKLEKTFHYDASYLRYLSRVDPSGLRKFTLATLVGGRTRGVPANALHAAKIIAARGEDCGPCTQLATDMALQAGVPPEIVTAILTDDEAGMGPDAAVGWRLAQGVAQHRGDLVDAAIQEIKERWGERAHTTLALAIAGTRLFPTLKAGLGYAKTCHRISVGENEISPKRTAA